MFKVGDKVKILNKNGAPVNIGDTGIIIRVRESDYTPSYIFYDVIMDFPNDEAKDTYWSFKEEHLELLNKHMHPMAEQLNDKLTTLPTDSNERKGYPMLSGCLKYFPAALAGVSHISKLGNDKHNPGQDLHHSRGKSTDHGDCIIRHLTDVEDLLAGLKRDNKEITPEQVLLEVNQMVWRALAYSQLLHEKFGAPLAPGAVVDNESKQG